MSKEHLKSSIMDLMNFYKKNVTFAEIERLLNNQNISVNGSYRFYFPGNQSIIIWEGMSEEFAQALEELIFIDKVITLKVSHEKYYFLDGKVLNLKPTYKFDCEYKKVRWLPTFIELGSI
ncbi:hypothetical protein SZL87_15165 [Exiguobacterium indicum]|uniref:Pathogenicity island protein n=1 Tax=Exiguobacterium indicum TaxID=296995 RepID=A0ABU8ELG0_9BACL